MDFLPAALMPFAGYRQFVVYAITPSKTREGKTDKIPIDPTTKTLLKWSTPENWLSPDDAISHARKLGVGYGAGFVFTDSDPFWFLDIDDCLQPDGAWSPLALSLCSAFSGAAIEISSSGRGLHIFGRGRVPSHSTRDPHKLKLEFYTSNRFCALTGSNAIGNADTDHTPTLTWLVSNYFPPVASPDRQSHAGSTNWRERLNRDYDSPVADWNGPTDDADLIRRALRPTSARAIFGDGASFEDLWECNVAVLQKAYTDAEREHGYNESSADRALAQHLCFWTGNHGTRIEKLMLQSGLSREKWDRDDYLPRTIISACDTHKTWLQDKPVEQTAPVNVTTAVSGQTFLSLEQQATLFRGCTYISSAHAVLVPGGYVLDPARFRVEFGGFSFPMDSRNERVSRNAWEAFTESQALRHPRAHGSTFLPKLSPGSVIDQDGEKLANLWWPITTRRVVGDIAPFMNHLNKVLPDNRDQYILLSYMASCIKYKGEKFQWCPIIQGVEGNGKTLFTRCVAYAIGHRYSYFPRAEEITARFNDWMYCKLFIGIEDIYTPSSSREVIEALKPMITSNRLEIEPKGGKKLTLDVCCNYIINTNHKDGLRKNKNDRRFAPFYTPQQNVEDLRRDGMHGDYFHKLYWWLNHNDGYAKVSEFLHEYPIAPEFNPVESCQRAPITSSTDDAIAHGYGGVEQEILEAIDQGKLGFRNGWVSSNSLDGLLTTINAARKIPPNKRRDLLKSLGYIWHPALREGRVTTIVQPDNSKPRLYIREDHSDVGVQSTAEVMKKYTDSQK